MDLLSPLVSPEALPLVFHFLELSVSLVLVCRDSRDPVVSSRESGWSEGQSRIKESTMTGNSDPGSILGREEQYVSHGQGEAGMCTKWKAKQKGLAESDARVGSQATRQRLLALERVSVMQG